MATISEIKNRVQSTPPSQIIVTEYCQKKADKRRVDLEQAIDNLLNRDDGAWEFSPRRDVKGKRVIAYLNVSRKKAQKYVLEVNQSIYLINVIVIEGKKQRWLTEP